MKKSYITIIASALLIFCIFTYNTNIKNKIIEKDYSIIVKTNCNLGLQVNEMILSEDWEKNINQKTRIQNMLNIIYESAHEGSGYEIKDKAYLDVFANLNYFEDYVVAIKGVLKDSYLSTEEKLFIKASNENLIQLKDNIDKKQGR